MDQLKNSCHREMSIGGVQYRYVSITALEERLACSTRRLPRCLRVLAENVLRNVGHNDVEEQDLTRLLNWNAAGKDILAIPFHPARVLLQDYTGLPSLVDLAAMRDGVSELGFDPKIINPRIPIDLVIDHSLIVDQSASADALRFNLAREFERNTERYRFAKWAKSALNGVRVVPPGNGILHQINVEQIAQVVFEETSGQDRWLYPDTMVGTDSHSTMVNGIGVLGWGVGGIEAEAAMLGLPLVVSLRRVIGVRLIGALPAGSTATDLVLTLTQRLRAFGVVDCFVEFFGPALDRLAVADRVTVANMAPEYGSSVAYFPVDDATLRYLEMTGRSAEHVALVEAYMKAQGLWRDVHDDETLCFSDVVEFDLSEVVPSVAGPSRPQDLVPLPDVARSFKEAFDPSQFDREMLSDGSVVIAAITSCTNTSNPSVMFAAGLLARKARERGLRTRAWVKPSLTPGSRVVGDYLERSGLQSDLDALGFQIAGFGCATCCGNSGSLDKKVEFDIEVNATVAAAVLSGNRNFEARVHRLARASYLMSPPLVVAYAIAGNVQIDLTKEPLGTGSDGAPVFLTDIWPNEAEIDFQMTSFITTAAFTHAYSSLYEGDESWTALSAPGNAQFPWEAESTYIRRPPYLDDFAPDAPSVRDIEDAKILVMLGDSTTTDHISPGGAIEASSVAGLFLASHGVRERDFNQYGARRANHEVMVRGTFANIRLRNELVPGIEGGFSRTAPDEAVIPIYDAAMSHQRSNTPLIIVAGKEYGTGSSRDWAAKGTHLLGVRAVIAESFERIHRSNLIMMGVLPLQFPSGIDRKTLSLDGSERFSFNNLKMAAVPDGMVTMQIFRANGSQETASLICRLDTLNELKIWRHSGMMPYVIRQFTAEIVS